MFETITQSNYTQARYYVIDCIETAINHDDENAIGYRYGVIDITQGINFYYIAGNYNLTEKQYDNLINYAQKYAEKEVSKKWK